MPISFLHMFYHIVFLYKDAIIHNTYIYFLLYLYHIHVTHSHDYHITRISNRDSIDSTIASFSYFSTLRAYKHA